MLEYVISDIRVCHNTPLKMFGIRQLVSSQQKSNSNSFQRAWRTMSMDQSSESVKNVHSPGTYDKWLLVLRRVYPSFDKVPPTVSVQTLKITRDWFRVRASIVTMFVAAGLLYYTIKGSRKEYTERMQDVEKKH